MSKHKILAYIDIEDLECSFYAKEDYSAIACWTEQWVPALFSHIIELREALVYAEIKASAEYARGCEQTTREFQDRSHA